MSKQVLYKTLTATGTSPYQSATWALPQGDQPGEWMPAIKGPLELCANGYHLCTEEHLVQWLGATIYEAELEADSEVLEGDNKRACRGPVRLVRKLDAWTDTTSRLFAADCAERVLPIWQRRYPDDGRPAEAIAAARAFARGEISGAARDAAWAAARDDQNERLTKMLIAERKGK